MYTTLRVLRDGPVLTVHLSRPEVHNAFDERLIAELTRVFSEVEGGVRVVILTGDGPYFSAGADLNWMRRSVTYDHEHNLRDAEALLTMYRAIDECPRPVIARVNGSAFGGAVGLIACADIAVAVDGAQFVFSEVKLGIVPAVIAPFVLRKIGPGQARRYFASAETFDAARARELGLVHEVVSEAALNERVETLTRAILGNGPEAIAAAKLLIRQIEALTTQAARDVTVATIARLRTSAEGQEGLSAFLDKRKPSWS